MKKLVLYSLISVCATLSISAQTIENCRYKSKDIPLYGRVRIVEYSADFKIKVVSNYNPDLKVQRVEDYPDACGKWQFVEYNEDFTVQIAGESEVADFTIQYVTDYPGTGSSWSSNDYNLGVRKNDTYWFYHDLSKTTCMTHTGTISRSKINSIPLYGRVKIVEDSADFNVFVVDDEKLKTFLYFKFKDHLRVKKVEYEPSICGEWQFVDTDPDFTIKIVEEGDRSRDFMIYYVDHSPGVVLCEE